MKVEFQVVREFSFSNEVIEVLLPKGVYILEAYGASGGSSREQYTTARKEHSSIENKACCYEDQTVTQIYKGNTQCNFQNSQPGSGGYVKGKLNLRTPTNIFINTGGKGKPGQSSNVVIEGGHNGGGNGRFTAGSGGGATDFRVLNNSLFNRFLVAGGGGGSDNSISSDTSKYDDGSGGSGGLPGQGMWHNGNYQPDLETNTTYGFSFGYGQNHDDSSKSESAGGGGGFFGGFTGIDGNAGASGGSSFALSYGVDIPEGEIEVTDGSGNFVEKGEYQLKNKREYYLTDVVYATGVWSGDGMARITLVSELSQCSCRRSRTIDTFNIYVFVCILCCRQKSYV